MNVSLQFFLAWFVAGLVNNITGFGAALVAMPFIANSVPLHTAVPASTLIVLALNLLVGWRYRRFIHWGRLRHLFLGGVIGTVAGVLLMRVASNEALGLGMGGFMVVYAAWCLLSRKQRPRALGPGWGIVAGFASTTLGALLGFNGPPLALYVAKTGWPQEEAKGVLGACFIMTGITIATGQLLAGVHNSGTLAGFAAGCPGVLLGGMVGFYLSRFFSQKWYERAVLVLVMVAGARMVYSCL